jgi:hypothetical protein
MTLFGTTLDGPQIAALVGLLATLALWLIVLGRERGYAKWVRWTRDGQQARRDAGVEARKEPTQPSRGPWG